MLKAMLISQVAGPMIRHGATAIGGFLVAQGITEPGASQEVVGAIVTLGGVLLSFAEKTVR